MLRLFLFCRSPGPSGIAAAMRGLQWRILLFPLFDFFWAGCETISDWDFLVFSQKWPTSFCIHYKDGNPARTCLMPEDNEEWTIHGIWPSKFGEEGPFFCDQFVPFDPEKISPIIWRLQKFWPNLEGGKSADSLWEHEWTKHGTCAIGFEPLSGERKYFEGGLNLYAKYNMTSLLRKLNILPERSKEYNVKNIIREIHEALGKAPYISCIEEMRNRKFYLSEIRLCLNKNEELIDCGNGTFSKHFDSSVHSVTNCPVEEAIIYPDVEEPSLPNWKVRSGEANMN